MEKRLNVLLITVDSLRADAIDLGDQNGSTPNIRRLARRGILFTQAIANGPRTPSSFPSILASVYPLVSGETGLPEGMKTWAEAMSEIGYASAGFNPDNPYLTAELGYSRGFDHFVDFWTDKAAADRKPRGMVKRWKKDIQDLIGKRSLAALLFLQALRPRTHVQYASGERITESAIEWIRGQGERPFFCWVHYMDVHFPYLLEEVPTTIERFRYCVAFVLSMLKLYRLPVKWMKILYARKVALIDALLGRWIEALHALGIDRNTLVLFTSDHGERLGENGQFTHGPDLCENLLRVPMILSIPGGTEDLKKSDHSGVSAPVQRGLRILTPATISSQVALIDLAPSVLDFLGCPPPLGFQGKSFLPFITGRSAEGREYVFSQTTHSGSHQSRGMIAGKFRLLSCRSAGWKFIYDEETNLEKLFDLVRDPQEKKNLLQVRPDHAEEFRQRLKIHLEEISAASRLYQNRTNRQGDSDLLRERLARLGYL